MLTVSDGGDEALRDGLLGCPGCPGTLRPWGYARVRLVRHGGGGLQVRPRRARCAACGRTQVLLPCQLLSRRRDAVADVGAVLEAYAQGTGYRRAAVALAIPVPTVRNWVKRLRDRWPLIITFFAPAPPDGRPADDPATATRALRRAATRAGWSSAPWEFASMRTNGSLLATELVTNTS